MIAIQKSAVVLSAHNYRGSLLFLRLFFNTLESIQPSNFYGGFVGLGFFFGWVVFFFPL